MGKRNQKYKKNKTKSFHLMYRHVSVIKREKLFLSTNNRDTVGKFRKGDYLPRSKLYKFHYD